MQSSNSSQSSACRLTTGKMEHAKSSSYSNAFDLLVSEMQADIDGCIRSLHLQSTPASDLNVAFSKLKIIEVCIHQLNTVVDSFKLKRDVLESILRNKLLRKGATKACPDTAVPFRRENTCRSAVDMGIANRKLVDTPRSPRVDVIEMSSLCDSNMPNIPLFFLKDSGEYAVKLFNRVIRGTMANVYVKQRHASSDSIGMPNYSWSHVTAKKTACDEPDSLTVRSAMYSHERGKMDLPNTRFISGLYDIDQMAGVNQHEVDLRCRQLMHDMLVLSYLLNTTHPTNPMRSV